MSELVIINDVPPRWREENDVIYLTVTLDQPTSSEEWIERMEKRGVGSYAKTAFPARDFKCSFVGMYKIAILKGSLFDDDDRGAQKIFAKADEMKLVKANADIACLIREQFSDEEIQTMGLWWIITLLASYSNAYTSQCLLTTHGGGGGRWLHAYDVYPKNRWNRECGFVFLDSRS